ncbi:MAG: phospholipase D-like domain-containing protein, partial [Lautropia sp.]|nr:phospholipase D-like domain-containing protein [Lautropia sp.]
KITLIDGRITYCGSQNCADEAFRIKAKYAPWVDIMLRLEGPVVDQMQLLFASDWMQATGEVLAVFEREGAPVPLPAGRGGVDVVPAGGQGGCMTDEHAAGPALARGASAQSLASVQGAPAPEPAPDAGQDMETGAEPHADAALPLGGFAAQVVGDGPTERRRSAPQLMSTLIACSRGQLTISTPYFVPDATVLEALCAAALRGVRVTLILPERNDSWIVAGASRSNYARLLTAGVLIHEYRHGLLHAKTLTVDGELCFIGSTNLDLRSFDLNFENNVLLQDEAMTAAVMARQQEYIEGSRPVTLAEVRAWPMHRRIWNNVLATLGPVL